MRMRLPWLLVILWIGFASLIVLGGYAMLSACDFGGTLNLYGYKYCAAAAAPGRLAVERERERELRAHVLEAEIRLARLPSCAPPAPPQPPPAPCCGNRAEAPHPPPLPPQPGSDEQLKIPARIQDLKGCWQSVRGDIPIVTDDEARRPVGNVRICLCFNERGKGAVLMKFTDGDTCRAPLSARLGSGELFLRHGRIPCKAHSHHVAEEILCREADAESASCDTQSLGRTRTRTTGEKYRRVSENHCLRND